MHVLHHFTDISINIIIIILDGFNFRNPNQKTFLAWQVWIIMIH